MYRKKTKHRKNKIKLSYCDKFIYTIGYIIVILLWSLLVIASFILPKIICFNNINVVAYSITLWRFLIILPLAFMGIVPIYYLGQKYDDAIPLFSSRGNNKEKTRIINSLCYLMIG